MGAVAGAAGVLDMRSAPAPLRPLSLLGAMALLAAISLALIATRYLELTRALTTFEVAVASAELAPPSPEGGQLRLVAAFRHGSRWPLLLRSAHLVVYVDGDYLWGASYDYMANPITIEPRKTVEQALLLQIPAERLASPALTRSPWEARSFTLVLSGTLDLPFAEGRAWSRTFQVPAPLRSPQDRFPSPGPAAGSPEGGGKP